MPGFPKLSGETMRRRDLVTAGLLALPVAALPVAARRAHAATDAAATKVVLELFTSQGCSSCPPADALLGELSREAGIIALAWHVDYWNGLGWRDRFSRPEWTERQKSYAQKLQDEVYTPALVVNGAAMVVGSNRAAVRLAIASAAPRSVTATLRRSASGLEAEISEKLDAVTALLVTYDPEQATQVDAGENGGRRLVDYRVVRDARIVDELRPKMTLPPVAENQGAVLLIQDARWRVIAAAESPPRPTA
jgi:hypothetical protein